MIEICRQQISVDTASIAAGPQTRIMECGEVATESVFVNGAVHLMCRRCAQESCERFHGVQVSQEREADATRLRDMAAVVAAWVSEFDARPEIGAWLAEVAQGLAGLERDVLEGRA
jgi:hypothetical protein